MTDRRGGTGGAVSTVIIGELITGMKGREEKEGLKERKKEKM